MSDIEAEKIQKSRRRPLEQSSDSDEDIPSKSYRSGEKFTTDCLRKMIAALQGTSKNTSNTNVVPEFDPDNKSQDVKRWLRKVNECVVIYNWDEQQTVHFALQKLRGLAKKWYEALPSLNFSWPEWQVKLTKAFPNDENYGKLLEEMLDRRSRADETLREYFYDKLALLSKCEIEGRKAVDCIIHGISDLSVKNGAQALKCNEPEDLLNYLASQQTLEKSQGLNNFSRRKQEFRGSSGATSRNTNLNSRGIRNGVTCFNCQERGHSYYNCPKPIVKCNKCNRVGHNYDNCNRKPLNSYTNTNTSEDHKNILRILTNSKPETSSGSRRDKNDDNHNIILNVEYLANEYSHMKDKFHKTIYANKVMMQSYVDFGSDCSLIKSHEAESLGLSKIKHNLPVIKGFGNLGIMPLYRSKINIQIDEVEAEIDIYIVDDNLLHTSVLIGQNFTELPFVTVMKDSQNLLFYHSPNVETTNTVANLKLFVKDEVTIEIGGLVNVFSTDQYTGDIYVDGDIRAIPNREYHIHRGCYRLEKGMGFVFVTILTKTPVTFRVNSLLARVQTAVASTFAIDSEKVTDTILNISDIKVGAITDQSTKDKLYELLQKYRLCFASKLSELGCARNTDMIIELSDKVPVVYRPYRLSLPERQKVRMIVDELLENDIIQESESNYASPVLLVSKKNGESRLCVDFRALNSKTIKDKYPLPLIEDQVTNLSGNKYFTTLDLASGYYQIPVQKESRHLTAFVTPDGHYEFKRMPFGLANAPAVFQRMINKLLGSKRFTTALAYMDDILIPSTTVDEGFERLEEILELLQNAGLTLKLPKCSFFDSKIDYLGYEISSSGIQPGEKKIEAVKNFPKPKNTREVRQFLGLASYFRKFVQGFGEIARPLTKLLKKHSVWQWGEKEDQSFQSLKSKLIERPILALYDPSLITELHTDASSIGLGGILLQKQTDSGHLKPVAYFSRQTTAEESNFHSYELETLAVVCSLKKFRVYLLGLEFTVLTDCNALRTTLSKRDLIPRIARWWLQISEFNFNIEYRPGCKMNHVDALSRNPCLDNNSSEVALRTLNITSENWLTSLQIADPELKRIKNILKPDNEEEIVELKKNYIVKNHILYRKVNNNDLRLVVPKSARWQVCKANHDDIGHFGFAKTFERIQSRYWFRNLRKFIKKYVAACINCAYNKDTSAKKRSGFLHPIEKVAVPFHTLHLDHLGPFVKSKSGHSYILTIVDAFTKYLFARPVRDTKTKNVVDVLEKLFNDFGIPYRIISDRGTAFTSGRFKEFCMDKGIKHILNAVACPRANGQAERFNQTILSALSTQNFNKDERDWEKHVGKVQWGINNTINATTKKSASELLFGIKLNGVSDNKLLDHDFGDKTSVILPDISEIRKEASENIQSIQRKQKEIYDSSRTPAQKYSVGDLIKITKTNFNNDGKSKKLLPKFIGPYKIINCLGNDRYEISNVPGFTTKKYRSVVAADRIRPWIHVSALDVIDESDSTAESDENGE